ncbi:septum formation inhibitor Maf [Thalassomonas viridans]|uniref:dTTP/UTP pyrophosphatase n=1 Tax=Thalassomonas viridans TaxID=137584 RepID=A0AAE9Z3G8_9GAMM|nr:Maf family protein [Thalassomonas viridans]WDE04487.1 septum formation inhibitor Maf [Thalassomonas viridans]
MKLVLASKSPRRSELLAQLGYQFDCIAADIDESVLTGESPGNYVERLSGEKAAAIAETFEKTQADNTLVLGSDTAVVVDDVILGKPKDINDGQRMLAMLSGRSHQVITGIAVAHAGKITSELVVTEVSFKSLSPQEIKRYWQTGEPQDKAGAYGIQGIGGQFVTGIRGSYSAVVGLPLYETAQILLACGMPTQVQTDE